MRHSTTENRYTLTTFLHFTLNMSTIDNYKHTFTISSNFHTGELKGPAGPAFFCRAQLVHTSSLTGQFMEYDVCHLYPDRILLAYLP
jgi:hypothetical protein